MITAIPGLTDCAYDALLGIYEQDRTLWAAVYAVGQITGMDGAAGVRHLCAAHRIDPDQE